MNTCGDFAEVLILNGLRSQKNRQNTASLDPFILKDLAEYGRDALKMKNAARGLPHSRNAKFYRKKDSTDWKRSNGNFLGVSNLI
jgi:hypothetical protein